VRDSSPAAATPIDGRQFFEATFPDRDSPALSKVTMTKAGEPKDLQQKKEESQQRHAVIERDVMRVLGRPADLHQVQVRQVGQDHYRVNVLIGTDTS
jgi:hypothetical protein